MPEDTVLRLRQSTLGENRYHVEIEVERDGARRTAGARFEFELTGDEQRDLRWYFEDYLQSVADEPSAQIARRIEREMRDVGARLFAAVFEANGDTRRRWHDVADDLPGTRVEIAPDLAGATALPWELLFDPETETYLALQARTFARTHTHAPRAPHTPAGAGAVRILLAICRPGGERDVAFRSVAMRILKALSAEAARAFQIEVLRPPTFDCLARRLRAAHEAGEPIHAVHFDGHGDFLDVGALFEDWHDDVGRDDMMRRLGLDPRRFSPHAVYPRPRRPGDRGYLLFENPDSAENVRLVDGPELGALLYETGVPVLVLNACRSAHAEAAPAPEQVEGDAHGAVRAFGSLAQEVMDAGVAGVVAMRYNVYVVTAAQFVATLYAGLARGATLGAAATAGRKQLHADPLREIAFEPRPLQDWPVPVVYEAAPVRLFPAPAAADAPTLDIRVTAGDAVSASGLDPALPAEPDAGFFGRDETLLALDRAFDDQRLVLLHAYAGSGKTVTAAEFARWYALTGGVRGPVLFTSFESYTPLPRVLDQIGDTFGQALEQAGVHWLALADDARRQVALQVLAQVPVLWIWDNVEPVTGFPAGTPSDWTPEEQAALVAFLRAAQGTRAKFLLTSRRDERAWLGDLPRRVTLPPMPMQERVLLARALAEKHGYRLHDVEDWRPLLRFTEGNPMAVTVVAGQALRQGVRTRAQVEAFVEALQAGEAGIDDADEAEGRSRSLAASLGYGFAHAFEADEQQVLALLHLFQGFVDVAVLLLMGNPEADYSLPELRGLTREAGIALLDRAAEIGLLRAHGGGYYAIHPALPWYFGSLFRAHYPEAEGRTTARDARRAFVEAMGALGNYYHRQYNEGNRGVLGALRAEEANLRHARWLALRHGWWGAVTSAMQGLRTLYAHTGRRAEWARLVGEIVPAFVDPATDGPLSGREGEWSLVTQHRMRLAMEARDWAAAERLQRARVEWDRRQAAPALALSAGQLDGAARNAVRSLAVSLEQLAIVLREQGKAECVEPSKEAIGLYQQLGDRATEAISAFNLGHAYKDLPTLRDLDEAERWYRRSLALHAEGDRQGRARCQGQLGLVAKERFLDARKAGRPGEEQQRHLSDALGFYGQALALLPPDAVDDLAVAHNQIAGIYYEVGDVDRALPHYREAIRYFEAAGDHYHAGVARRNVALALEQAGRLPDALAYARAALANFQPYGAGAADMIQRAQGLIAELEQAMRGGG